MPNPSGVAMQEEWGDPVPSIILELDVAIEVKKMIEGQNHDQQKVNKFIKAVESARTE